MSNGNPPQLTGWQYVTLEIAKLVLGLATTIGSLMAANWAYDARSEARANKTRIKNTEKRMYDIQVHQRKAIIGAPAPPPVTDE